MRDEPSETLKGRTARSCRPHKRCCKIQTVGRWPWKSEPAKECVTTHLPNLAALKKDGAEAGASYVSAPPHQTAGRVGRRGGQPRKLSPQGGVEGPLVQILVEVATKQVRPLLTEVEKGFVRTAMGHE